MNGAEYWQARTEQRLIEAEAIAGQLEKRMKKAILEANSDLENQIYRLYGKYAADNQLSYAEAKKYLTNYERREFQKDLKFYLEKAQDSRYRREYRSYLQALSTRARVFRLEEYQARLQIIAETLYQEELIPSAGSAAKEIFTESYLKAGFDLSQFLGVAVSFAMPSERLLRTVTEYPWSGKNFSQKWQEHCSNFEAVLNEVLTKGLVAGYSNEKMARELRDKTNAAYHRAMRLVRTETNYIHNQATASLYEGLGVKQYRYLATLDNKTSLMCRELDGKVFSYQDIKVGVNYPPLHPWCRSTTIPIVYEDENMGTRIARDENGKNIKVPADMTYEDWYAQFINTSISGLKGTVKNSRMKIAYKANETMLLTMEQTIAKAEEFAQSADYEGITTFQELRSVTNSKLGYDGLPIVMPKDEFIKAAKQKMILYRGIHAGNGKSAEEIRDEFLYGNLWTGNTGGATYGNGVYFTATEAIANSKEYTGNDGVIVKMILKDNTRIIDFCEIADEFLSMKKANHVNTVCKQILGDYGQYAAMKGYDAIALNGYNGKDYIILLNRVQAIVEE